MIQIICRVLIHSLWQGALLTAAAGGVVLFTKSSAAAVRYRLLCALFFLFLAGSGMTYWYELYSGDGVGGGDGWSGPAGSLLPVVAEISRYCSDHARAIVTGWFIVVSLKCARLATGWNYAQRIRRNGLVAPGRWAKKVRSLGRQLGIRRRVTLLESRLARVPMVIGHLRPVIFVPLGLLNHLPAAEMEAVILHELAHIRRHDYFVNFLQHIAESLFFFNPGVVWLSSLLREERENCCDDMAISRTNDRVGFVRALVRFKEHALRADSTLADSVLAFPAGKRQLLQRVLRITHQQNKGLGGGERVFFMGSCLFAVVLLVSVHGGLTDTGNGYALISKSGVGELLNPTPRDTGEPGTVGEKPEPGSGQPVEKQTLKSRKQKAQEELMKSRERESKAELMKRWEKYANEELMKDQARESKEELSKMDKARQDGLQIQQETRQAQQTLIRAERDRGALVLDQRQLTKNKQQAERELMQAQEERTRADLNQKQATMEKLRIDLEKALLIREKTEKDQIRTPKER